MDDLLHDFLTESNENLEQLDRDIVALEQNPDESSLIHGIFRTIHTIKGTCGFIGLDRLESVAHAAENVLGALREGELRVSGAVITDVLAAIDVIKDILDELERTQEEPDGDDSELITRLEAWLPDTAHAPDLDWSEILAEAAKRPEFDTGVDGASPEAPEPGATTPEEASATSSVPSAAPGRRSSSKKVAASSDAATDGATDHRGPVADSTLRVHVNLLDKLMTLVGELVLDRNRLLQLTALREDAAVTSTVQHLNRVTSDLQEAVMRTRMQPIGGAWTKLPRLVRDLGQMSGKKMQLEMHGEETELDRQVLQAIVDPLTHMVRNSADHGIESPAARRAAGKPDGGTIRLDAYHEGGHVIIEVSDDGAGIDVARVREKAVDRGLVAREAAETLNDAQVLRYIFEPGFSTAEKVTNVSGRGVGMDVVRTNIERIGGEIELQSTPGEGSVVRIKIPLTLAIIPALVVTAGSGRYAIPQVNLLELVRISGASDEPGVEMLHGAPVYRLRGELLPLVFLDEVFGASNSSELTNRELNIVVLQVEGRAFGLVVDGLSDSEEIVVKPLGRYLQGLAAFAGATIMGDGTVALILDVPGIARHARVVDDAQTRESETQTRERGVTADEDARTLLIVQVGERGRAAIELEHVSRLEEFRAEDVEYSNGQMVAQYRGDIIPLISISEWLGQEPLSVETRVAIPVVVHSHGDRTVGLVVDRIQDIVEQEIEVRAGRGGRGLFGTAVIQGRVTDLLDLDLIVSDQLALDIEQRALELEAVA